MENKQFPQEEPIADTSFLPGLDPELDAELTAQLEADQEAALIEQIIEEHHREEPIAEVPVMEETAAEILPAEIPAEAAGEEAEESVTIGFDEPIYVENFDHSAEEAEIMDFDFSEPDYDEGFRDTAEDSGFEELFQSPTAQPRNTESRTVRPPRKGRPKRKKGYGLLGIPHLIATVVWLAIIVSVGVSLGRMLWLCAADVLAFGRENKQVTVTVSAEDSITDIAGKLHSAGLIRYPKLFKLYADIAVDEGEIATGTFTLNTIYDYHAIVNGMSAYSSFRNVVEDVLIPEGYNCRQIFQLLEEKGICSVAELEEYAASGEFSDYWFLEGVQRGDKYCLEGFLFPDTYDFYEGSTPREALGKMLTAFGSRFTDDMRGKIDVLNGTLSDMMRANGCSNAHIAENQFTVYELVIVASLIEEETSSAAESPKIASVIYNRLTQDQAHERYLGIDAALLYALGEHKEELTAADLALDSPYNTRIYAGLVPTPITNPGLDSLSAALNPADTDFYYYLLNPSTGVHTFSETAAEHDALKEKYGY